MKRQFFALLIGSLGGMALAYFFRDADELWIGAGLGAFICGLILNFDALLGFGIGKLRHISTNRYWLASSGAVLGGSLALVLSLALLGSIGWIGSCWG
jgi:hypothetical protein